VKGTTTVGFIELVNGMKLNPTSHWLNQHVTGLMVDLLLGIHISGTSFRKVNQSNRGCNCTGSSPLASRPESGMAWFPKICGPENGGFVFLFGFQMAIFFKEKMRIDQRI